jgi:hypothetical protein
MLQGKGTEAAEHGLIACGVGISNIPYGAWAFAPSVLTIYLKALDV